METDYRIKNLRSGFGHDNAGMDCSLYKNNTRVATCSDDGWGGEMEINFLNQKFEDEFNEDLKKIKEEEIKKGEKSEFMTSYYKDEKATFYFNSEVFILNLVEKFEAQKAIKNRCKKNTLFQIGKQIGTKEYYEIKGLHNRDNVVNYLKKKFPNEKILILNDKY